MKSDKYPLDKKDLDIYLNMLQRQRIKFYKSPETLKELDRMAVKAINLHLNGVNNDI